MNRHGGIPIVAKHLGLKVDVCKKPTGYWNDFQVLKSELLEFIENHGEPSVMPSHEDLKRAKRIESWKGNY